MEALGYGKKAIQLRYANQPAAIDREYFDLLSTGHFVHRRFQHRQTDRFQVRLARKKGCTQHFTRKHQTALADHVS